MRLILYVPLQTVSLNLKISKYPAQLAGTFIIVRTAHISAFETRSPYVNPFDRKNLNRSFPGSPHGTQTDRIAWTLSTKIIPQADILIDVHSGDGAEWLEDFVGAYGGPLATDYPTAFKIAEAFGFTNVVRYKMNTQKQIDTGRSLNRQAVAQGLPTVLVEIGENGLRKVEHVNAIVNGMKNTMHLLGMLEKGVDQIIPPKRYFESTSSVPVDHSGIWTPVSSEGQEVEKGEILGEIHDYSGTKIQIVTAPQNGYMLYGLNGPPVRKGESVVTIGNLVPRDQLVP